MNTFHKIQILSIFFKVNKTSCLSPGKRTITRPGYPDRKRARQQTQQTSRQAKLHRLRPEEDRQSSLVLSKLHEGTTYETSVDFAVTRETSRRNPTQINKFKKAKTCSCSNVSFYAHCARSGDYRILYVIFTYTIILNVKCNT